MKIRLFVSAIIGLLLISCIEIGSLQKKIDLSNIDLTKTLDIKPPKDGVAIVTSDLDTIAITTVAQTVVVNKFAPVDSPNKPIRTEKKKRRMRKNSFIILSAYFILSVIFFIFFYLFFLI